RPTTVSSFTSRSRSRAASTASRLAARRRWARTSASPCFARRSDALSRLRLLGRLRLALERVLEADADALRLLEATLFQRRLQPLVAKPHRPYCTIGHRCLRCPLVSGSPLLSHQTPRCQAPKLCHA